MRYPSDVASELVHAQIPLGGHRVDVREDRATRSPQDVRHSLGDGFVQMGASKPIYFSDDQLYSYPLVLEHRHYGVVELLDPNSPVYQNQRAFDIGSQQELVYELVPRVLDVFGSVRRPVAWEVAYAESVA